MQNSVSQLTATVNTYQQPLMRYANYRVKNKLVAALIVEAVMEDYSNKIADLPKDQVRLFLINNTLAKCKEWNFNK